ncbi:MAG: hypothetical protein ACFFFG_00680 [Candidatus Thorarchaeota archaeon]
MQKKFKFIIGVSLFCLLFSSVRMSVFLNSSILGNNLRLTTSSEKVHSMKVVFAVASEQEEFSYDDQEETLIRTYTRVEYNLSFEIFTDNSSRTTLNSLNDSWVLELENLEILQSENAISFVTYEKSELTDVTTAKGIEICFSPEENMTHIYQFGGVFNETSYSVFNSLGVFYQHDMDTALWYLSLNFVVMDFTRDVSLIEAFSNHSLLDPYITRF